MRKLGIAIGLLAGCTDSHDEAPRLASNQALTFDQWKAAHPVWPGNTYVVRGDESVDAAGLYEAWAQTQAGALIVMHKSGQDVAWNSTQQHQLTYCIANGFGARKAKVVTAMKAATVDSWMSFADVTFTYEASQDATCDATNNNVMFNVSPMPDITPRPAARAFYPDAARSGRSLFIDGNAFEQSHTLSAILTHEVGHILGFRHEHIRPESNATSSSCTEGTSWRALSAYDAASVMHYKTCNGTAVTYAISALDRQGAIALYGAKGATPTVPDDVVVFAAPLANAEVASPTEIALTVKSEFVDEVRLDIDGNRFAAWQVGPFTALAALGTPGLHELRAAAIKNNMEIDVETISVTVAASAELPDAEPGPGVDDDGDPAGAGCQATRGAAAGWLVLALLWLGRRRRR